MKTVTIHKQKVNSILRRHPWIFSGAIISDVTDLKDGEVVRVEDKNKQFLAIGHFQHATIAVRILSFIDCPIDTSFYIERLKNAVQLRNTIGLLSPTNTICRLVHGEGDQLPGLIIDYYNGVAVIQCHSIGMYLQINHIAEAIQEVLGENLQAIYSKSSDTLSSKVTTSDSYLYGFAETPIVAIEHGTKVYIDWINGQKTGYFIDQRENRKLLGAYSSGKKVLNTFCYSGGFSLLALQNGASLVHSVDSSKNAISLTDANVALNNFESRHRSIQADVMEYMKNLEEDYDIIILDPPAFAKHRDKRHQAIQGYKRLNAHAMRQIKKGGLLFTFSCSQVVDKQLFNNTIIAAAIEAGRNARIIEQLHQPADHPISAFHPEGEYLKGLVLELD